eukprot:2613503-Rhodomonas_salina.1
MACALVCLRCCDGRELAGEREMRAPPPPPHPHPLHAPDHGADGSCVCVAQRQRRAHQDAGRGERFSPRTLSSPYDRAPGLTPASRVLSAHTLQAPEYGSDKAEADARTIACCVCGERLNRGSSQRRGDGFIACERGDQAGKWQHWCGGGGGGCGWVNGVEERCADGGGVGAGADVEALSLERRGVQPSESLYEPRQTPGKAGRMKQTALLCVVRA